MRGLIQELADRFGTEIFVPHVTLRGQTDPAAVDLAGIAQHLATTTAPFGLDLVDVREEAHFFRCITLPTTLPPQLLHARADNSVPAPHVSLLYGDLTPELRRAAMANVRPHLPLRFFAAAATVVDLAGRPSHWASVATFPLRG